MPQPSALEHPQITVLYLLLLVFQFLHILEEIGLEAYQKAGSLDRYLKVASVLVIANAVPLFLMLLGRPAGYTLGLLGALMGIGNGIVHVVGYLKTRSIHGTVGAGLFTSLPLSIVGAVVLYQLATILFAS
jgi:hypothetical protein